ncbi:putative NADH dehydrogenase [Tieghemostelium lacteum]|uniref:Putative NADH dehydrogenase n=1 Tax=Tieghemostelium lacteum TaxID=361077 RepID=A0A152A2D8_TIELA|nr:putative NADH dehydrogenase [Tieghemostelium lacteum]|eukprot:KYR00231.1 putative NADH dehydrogenase [Tieghemostelium lacteum]
MSEQPKFQRYTRGELITARDSLWTVCGESMLAFEKCKMEKGDDPEACLQFSIAVMGCSSKIMRDLTSKCGEYLKAGSSCLNENNMRSLECDKEKLKLDECFTSKVLPKYQ